MLPLVLHERWHVSGSMPLAIVDPTVLVFVSL